MHRRWQSEAIEFVAGDPEFTRLARHYGKAKAARIRITEIMAEECERDGDLEAAERLRSCGGTGQR